MMDNSLLRLENLKLHFRITKGIVQAVDGVNFSLGHNEAVVVLGESGCGKSSLAKALLRLLPRNVAEYSGKVKVVKLNTDEAPGVAGRYNIMSIPTLMIFKNGERVDQIIGAQPKQAIAQKLQPHLG
jgi:thioredoxin-like negative regulator of GroEL